VIHHDRLRRNPGRRASNSTSAASTDLVDTGDSRSPVTAREYRSIARQLAAHPAKGDRLHSKHVQRRGVQQQELARPRRPEPAVDALRAAGDRPLALRAPGERVAAAGQLGQHRASPAPSRLGHGALAVLGGQPGRYRADVADALVDGLGPDAEQGGDGDLGQGEALVEGGGQEPVCEGEDGAAAGAGGCQSRTVTSTSAEACFALLVLEGHQRGDQGVPFRGREAGQGWMAQPGQVGAGLVERVLLGMLSGRLRVVSRDRRQASFRYLPARIEAQVVVI
jgi:hypothetical protein